jgi:transglutaminase-like putative cysteine protease
MNLYKAFKVSSTLMIAVGMLSLALAEGSFFFLALAVAGVVLGWVYERSPVMSRPTGTAAALLCMPLFVLDWQFVSLDVIVALGHILVLLQIIKLLMVKKNRDYLQMFLISLMQLTVAAALTIDFSYSVPFVLYLVFATWTLILFHLKREFERSLRISGEENLPDEVKAEKTRGVVTPSFFTGSTSICVLTLILTSIFFVAMPRISAGMLWGSQFRPQRVSGFSESIDLGISGEISLSDTQVMTVELVNITGPAHHLAYFRGVGLSHYDGQTWRKFTPEEIDPVTIEDVAVLNPKRKSYTMTLSDGKRVYDIFRHDPESKDTVIQKILQSPLDTQVLFGIHPIYKVEFRSREAPVAIEVDQLGSVYNQVSQYGYISYYAYSKYIDPESPELKDARTYPVVDGIDYTQLPAPGREFRYDDLRRHAQSIVSRAGANTPYEKVAAIERYLKNNHNYTRNIIHTPETEPVYDFLFNTKAGHCELFASSMAVLLRTLGIPVRVANGYVGGEWNSYGQFYVVRQKHAHAWVEVFFDRDRDPYNQNEIGWVRFDPTPPYSVDEGGFFSPVTNFFSYLRHKWIDYVISYSAVEQRKIAFEMRHRGLQMRGWLTRLFDSIKEFFSEPAEDARSKVLRLFLIFVAPVFVFLAVMVFLRGRKVRRRKSQRVVKPGHVSVKFYRDFLKLLEKAGLRRSYSQTPSEFARVVAATASGLAQPALAITVKFLEVRFGGREMSPGDGAAIHAAIERVRQGVRTLRAARRAGK